MTRRTRWLVGCGLLLLLGAVAVGGIVGAQYLTRWQAQRELDEAIAAVDALEPRWRLADVEADRQVVPPERNSAVVTREAFARLPAKWDGRATDEVEKVPPPIELSAELRARIAAELDANAGALDKARTIKELPFGRHRLDYKPDFLSTLVADQQNVRLIARLLDLDVCHALHRKDFVQAWQSNRALLNVGRSLGDEPLLISMLVRMAIDVITVRSLERTLALGELPADHLNERQQALDEEAAVPLFLIGIRGERAGNDLLLSNIGAGRVPLLATLENAGKGGAARPASWWDPVAEFFAAAMVLRSHATLLHYQTEMVEAARRPAPERYHELARIDAAFRADVRPGERSRLMAHVLFTHSVRVAEAEQRIQSNLSCGVAGLAAERFRLTHARWPRTLDELVQAGLLKAVPIDRVDGQPLRYRATADGIVIYSIGTDGLYAGTALDDLEAFDPNAIRAEFRLWDPPHRRQPAAPR